MNPNKPQLLNKNEIRTWLNKPVWYQSRTDVNDFGWAFIDPTTVSLAYSGEALRFCMLIKADKTSKRSYNWNTIDLYDRPAIKRLCSRCMNWISATPGQEPAHCSCHTQEAPRCRADNNFVGFQPDPYWEDKHYTVKTFVRQCELAGYNAERGVI